MSADRLDARRSEDFEKLARRRRTGLVSEFWVMLMRNKKWWLLPLLVVLLAIGTIIVLGGTAAAPFIYTLF
jgi:hypothetical protein